MLYYNLIKLEYWRSMNVNVIAKFDGSYRKHSDNSHSIGIGYSIKSNVENINKNNKYELSDQLSSEFAESLALMELLEELQNYSGYNIIIIGDCKILIDSINNGKYITKVAIQSEYISLLIENLKENNKVQLKWEPREHNKICDKLSKDKTTFIFNYINMKNNPINVVLKAYNEQDANERFQQIIQKMKQQEINQMKLNRKKKSLNQMIREFKRYGKAYA